MSVTLTLTFANIDEATAFLNKSATPAGPLTSGEAPAPKPAGKPKAEKPATPSAPAADAASAAPTPAAASGPKAEAAGEPAAKVLDYTKDVAPKVAEAQTKDRAATIALLEKLGARGADGKLRGSNVPADKLGELVDGLAAIITGAETVE